ncbi:MAG TPA: hypothetical protein DGR79_02205 [Clostridiales bacterium]|nr:hypothetical protein [Clostridiales bacterium]
MLFMRFGRWSSDEGDYITHEGSVPSAHRYGLPAAAFVIIWAAGSYASWFFGYYLGFAAAFLAALFVSSSMKVAAEWERMAVLRAGKFHRMAGPGIFFIIPILDTVPYILDLRIIPYNVPKQKTLTNDNVPVTVDAVVYYRIADPKAAVLNVEDYRRATQWGATTVLRDLIGKSTLDQLLSEREHLGREIRKHLDALTGDWGIEVRNVEVRDVVISEQLEDAIAREPAAEREKRARLKLAEAELLAAKTILDAARTYEQDPVALQLRSMNMVYEMCMEGRSTVIFVPTETKRAMPVPVGVYGVVDKLRGAGEEDTGPATRPQGRGEDTEDTGEA